jgi:DNA-binding CsgD family transcriptional regulator
MSETTRPKFRVPPLAQGIPYKEIADILSVSIDTVRMHIKGIYGKLHVHSRGEAVAKYLTK